MMQFIDQEADKVSLVDEFPPGEPEQRGDKSVCDMGTSTCDLADDSEQMTHFQGPKAAGLSNVEKVRLIARPWRKPEGQLNKWLLKLMLESVMMHVMSNPGIQNTAIYKKYMPFLQPVVIQELVEMLEDLNCVARTYLSTKSTASLFTSSKVERVTSGNLDDDMVLFEAKLDAPFKLGQFVTSLV